MALILNWRLWLATGLLAATFAAGWGVNGWRLSSALQTLKTEQARQLAGREAIARRAIESVRRQEAETATHYEAITDDLQTQRDTARLAAAAADARRVRDLAAARAATAARGGRLPETAPDAGGKPGTDPVGFLIAIRGEDEADARLADDLSRRLAACYRRAEADRGMTQ